MPTAAKLEANRANARLSTGPKTTEGKSAAARNSLKFGLFAGRDIVAPEDRTEYREFLENILQELAPANHMEGAYAAEIVSALWRLRRIARIEAELAADPLHPTAQPIERARAAATCALNRAVNQIRHAQSDRFARTLALGPDHVGDLAQADMHRIYRALSSRAACHIREMKLGMTLDTAHAGPVEVEFNPNFRPDPDENAEAPEQSETEHPEFTKRSQTAGPEIDERDLPGTPSDPPKGLWGSDSSLPPALSRRFPCATADEHAVSAKMAVIGLRYDTPNA